MYNLSVIIPAYNNLPQLLACLHSLRACAINNSRIEYIVQDDASTGYSVGLIEPLLANSERNEMNLGFPQNANRGAARASGDILFFVNQDVFATYSLSHGWDQAILSQFHDHSVGIVGARLLSVHGLIQSAGGGFDAKKQPYHRHLGSSVENNALANQGCEVSWTTGAALATRHTLWVTIGGFNAEYGRGYFEDVEYCLNARSRGVKVWYEPRCTLIHWVASTGGSPTFFNNARGFNQKGGGFCP